MKKLFFQIFLGIICTLIFFNGIAKAGITEEISNLNDHVDILTQEIRELRDETADLENFKTNFIEDVSAVLSINFNNIILFLAILIFVGAGILRQYMKKQYDTQYRILTDMITVLGISPKDIFKAQKKNLEKSGAKVK